MAILTILLWWRLLSETDLEGAPKGTFRSLLPPYHSDSLGFSGP